MSLFKTNITYNYSKPTRVKNVDGVRKKSRKQSEDKITEESEDKIVRDITNYFEQEQQDYYKPLIVGGFHSNNYIEYESNGDRNKTLSRNKTL